MQSLLLQGTRLQYLPVVLVLGLVLPPVSAACRYSPSGLKCVTGPLWWGKLSDPWLLNTTSVSYSILPSSGHLPLNIQSPPPLTSSYISFAPSVLLGTVLLPSSVFLVSCVCLSQCCPLIIQPPRCVWDPRRRCYCLLWRLLEHILQVTEIWVSLLYWYPFCCHNSPDVPLLEIHALPPRLFSPDFSQ